MTWLVFAVSFIGCALTLSLILIKPRDFEFLRGGSVAEQPAAKPAIPAATVKNESDATSTEEDGEAPEADEGEEETPQASEAAFKEAYLALMNFLESGLASVATKNFKFDSINKFGCHLFLAGAAEHMSRRSHLNHEQFVEMLTRSVSVLGTGPDMARKFCDKYDEYLLEPKYADMFRAGGDAMGRFADGSAKDSANPLADALQMWNKPAQPAGKEKFVTVLFTDIIGSTKMTQELGDAGAQEVVRKHNEIVRNALRRHSGIEVKHTGDGIMARFAVPSDAVMAAIGMQDAFAQHAKTEPKSAIHVRIGINAGEPIQEDGDIFGTTVQLAARICDKSKMGHVMVSNVVREACQGQSLRFADAGSFELKGIDGPVKLYYAARS